jgi:tetrahydromethanopterin S-methyltransferase subunit G
VPEPDRTILMFNEIRGELRRLNIRMDSIDRRLDHEFSEMHDRLRRLDERIDGFISRVERLEDK